MLEIIDTRKQQESFLKDADWGDVFEMDGHIFISVSDDEDETWLIDLTNYKAQKRNDFYSTTRITFLDAKLMIEKKKID